MEQNREEFNVESKVYVTSSRVSILFKILLKIIVVMFALAFIFSMIIDGFSISEFGKLCLAILVSLYYSDKAEYQFAMLDLVITETEVNLLYHNIKKGKKYSDLRVQIDRNDIIKIEKNHTLQAIQIYGKLQTQYEQKCEYCDNWVIYLGNYTDKVSEKINNILAIDIDNK